MDNFLCMKVSDAYEKSKSSTLADEIWRYKHPEEEIDVENREYVSWKKSIFLFLKVAVNAGLGELEVAFEVPTPLGDYIDVSLLGYSRNHENNEFGRLLIVELKQWSSIEPIENKDYVKISVGNGEADIRRHPIAQICEYESHMRMNHHGIYKNGRIAIDTLAYLHNFGSKSSLMAGPYVEWGKYADKVFAKGDEDGLINYLKETFSTEPNGNMASLLDDCGYVMSEAGFSGLLDALRGEENATMVKDQMVVVDKVREHLERQKINPHKEILVVSGGPGTGKTIIGMHFIYDYVNIFNSANVRDEVAFCLPKSKTVLAMIEHECGENKGAVTYLENIRNPKKLVVVDEAHRITGLDETLDGIFAKGINFLILLQDDHQTIRPGEDGTFKKIEDYAKSKGYEFTALNLTIQKRCESLGKLLDGLEKLFYNNGRYDGKSITSVKVFDRLDEMNTWIEKQAMTSRAKIVAPYCWEWKGNLDVEINDYGRIFRKSWNPGQPKEQVRWLCEANRSDQIACVYTCQGLDLDDVAFIWWDDLQWDEKSKQWKADLNKSWDRSFIKGIRKANLSQREIDILFINTYYVMLSRAKNKMGIWFKDEATKRHVVEVLGLEVYSNPSNNSTTEDSVHLVIGRPETAPETQALIIGNNYHKSYHRPDCQYAPRKLEKRVEFKSVEDARAAGFRPCSACNP